MNLWKNYYKILGVDPKASIEDITKKYRQLARENHPDFNENADENFIREINEAYDVLKNRATRAVYDRICALDLFEENEFSRENPFTGNNPFSDNEDINERKSYFGKPKNGDYYEGRDNFFNDELNNPYRDVSYNPDYQRREDQLNLIYDYLDKELHYLKAIENEFVENKKSILLYTSDIIINKLSLPFYNKSLFLLNVYKIKMNNDKEFKSKCEKITLAFYETLYKLARVLENNAYKCLCYNKTIEEKLNCIERSDELYETVFALLGMTIQEANIYDICNDKKLTKHEKKCNSLKYEICLCYRSYFKLAEKNKKILVKTYIK